MTTSKKTGILSTDEIVEEAFQNTEKKHPEKLSRDYIENNFSEVSELLFSEAYRIYLQHEKNAQKGLKEEILDSYKGGSFSRKDVSEIIDKSIEKASVFEKSLKQSRAARAGKAYEIITMNLLERIGIRNEHITQEDKKSGLRRIDIVVPDRKTAIEDPDHARFLSLKTSLKDRWKLVVEDQRPGQRTYLLTLLQREKITKEVADKATVAGIILYVPDRVKADFPNNTRIRKLSDLPRDLNKA